MWSYARGVRNNLPAVLAFALLLVQAVIPWTANPFVTQDGPSHIYMATIARDLALNGNSLYASAYSLQRQVKTNWSTTFLVNLLVLVFGFAHAEQVLASICVITGFFAFAYFCRSLNPLDSPWSPILNFLLNSWFLWIGFYNFYLGMVLCMFVAGYYIRHARAMTLRKTVLLITALTILFFTHVMPAVLALTAIGATGVWLNVIAPAVLERERKPLRAVLRDGARPLAYLAAALVPVGAFSLMFVRVSGQTTKYDPQLAWAWEVFPMHVFASTATRLGQQFLLYPAMLFYMATAIFAMKRREWASARGAIVITALICFAGYMLAPNSGFGGDEIKIRFAYAMFIFGGLVATTVSRMRPLRLPAGIYVACFLIATLMEIREVNVLNVSRAANTYMTALNQIPAGSTFVRLHFSTEKTRARYGYGDVALEPLYHVESLVAARRGLVNLADYQAATRVFPVSYSNAISETQAYQLWGLERPGAEGAATVQTLRNELPVRIDYVVVLGDEGPELTATVNAMGSTMRLVVSEPKNPFVRVYQRIGER